MTWMTKTWLILAGTVATSVAQDPVPQTEPAGDNPYNVFVVRNPFNIRPAPVQTNAPAPVVEAPPKLEIKLTGITFFGKRRAYFQVTEQSKQQKAEPQFWVMEAEEERDGLKVLEINEVDSKVRIRQDGTETLMSFLTHGIAAPAASAGSAVNVAGMPGAAGGQVHPGGAVHPNVGGYTGSIVPIPGVAPTASGLRQIPSRAPRLLPNQGGALADPNMAERYGLTAGQSTLPTVRAPEPPAHNLTSEEQVLLMELQKVAEPNKLLPPTPGLPGTTDTGPVPGRQGPPAFPAPPSLPGVPVRNR